MSFTKSEIEAMKEAEFQDRVVIPLFRAMGYRDVTGFGGGSQELGKDIIMWKPGDFDERVNYAVVVKAVPISGKAKGSGTASEVLNQIRQCFTTEYPDPVTTQSQRADRCIVISSQIIKKESINSIEGQLRDGHFDRLVNWLHPGTNLYSVIEKYLPQQNIFERLAAVKKDLDDPMSIVPYRIVADSDNNFTIHPKHDRAGEEMPFIIKGRFSFDTSTDEGRKAQEDLLNHFRKGTPVEVDGSHIEAFEFPEFLPDFIRPRPTADSKLILKPHRPEGIVPLRIKRVLADGTEYESDRLDCEIANVGTEEVTLKNDTQRTPLQVTFTFNSEEKSLTFNIQCHFHGFNVLEHLRALKLFVAMSKEGTTSIWRTDANVELINSNHWQIKVDEDFTFLTELLEALVLIQEKTKTLFLVPARSITKEETDTIFKVYEIVSKGKLILAKNQLKVDVKNETARERLLEFEKEKKSRIVGSFPGGHTFTVLDSAIDLGKAVLTAEAWISENNYKEISRKIDEGADPVEFVFEIDENDGVVDYLNFESEDRDTRISFVTEEAGT